jgi:exonuclease VII large subunit
MAQNGSHARRSLQQAMRRRLNDGRERLRWLTGRAALVSPAARLTQQMQSLDDLEDRLTRGMRQRLTELRADFVDAAACYGS